MGMVLVVATMRMVVAMMMIIVMAMMMTMMTIKSVSETAARNQNLGAKSKLAGSPIGNRIRPNQKLGTDEFETRSRA